MTDGSAPPEPVRSVTPALPPGGGHLIPAPSRRHLRDGGAASLLMPVYVCTFSRHGCPICALVQLLMIARSPFLRNHRWDCTSKFHPRRNSYLALLITARLIN